MSLANISIVGNLVKAPEQVEFTTGHKKTNLQVAVNNPPQQGKEKGSADFYQVELWGKLGDLALKYLDKGNQVAVSGRFQLDRWQDRDGKERMTPVIRATQLSLPPRLRVVGASEQVADLHSELSGEESETGTAAMVGEEISTYEFGPESDEGGSGDEFPKQSRSAPTELVLI